MIIEFKFLSESDDLSGLIGSLSHDDLNSLDDLDSLFDLRKAKNTSALDTEWFSWPQSPLKPLFVGLIVKNPVFLCYLAPSLSEAVEASLCHLYEIQGSKVKCPLLLNMPSKKNQQNYWSFYPSEPFTIAHFNVRHPVSTECNLTCEFGLIWKVTHCPGFLWMVMQRFKANKQAAFKCKRIDYCIDSFMWKGLAWLVLFRDAQCNYFLLTFLKAGLFK